MFYIYIYSIAGVPRYVGKGVGGRWLAHRKAKPNTRLSQTLRAIFESDNTWVMPEIREFETEREAIDAEIALIASIGRENMNEGPLWNITRGGQGWAGRPQSEETKAKLRAANLGKKHTVETKAKISALNLARDPAINEKVGLANRGKKRSETAKRNYANSKRGTKNPFFGKTHTEKVREAIRAANIGQSRTKGMILSAEHKRKISIKNSGDNNPACKVKKTEYPKIDAMRASGMTQKEIGLRIGISQGQVSKILLRK